MIGKNSDLQQLDEMVTALMAGPAQSASFLSGATAFLSETDERSARAKIAAISRLLSGPRWWHSHLQESQVQATLGQKKFGFAASAGGSTQLILKNLEERLINAEAGVQADLTSCDHYKERVLAKALPDDPYFHFQRFGEELAADLGLAHQLCAAGQRASSEDATAVLEFLKDLSESLLAGEALISTLADHVNREANTAGR